jgi:hypothetical protein
MHGRPLTAAQTEALENMHALTLRPPFQLHDAAAFIHEGTLRVSRVQAITAAGDLLVAFSVAVPQGELTAQRARWSLIPAAACDKVGVYVQDRGRWWRGPRWQLQLLDLRPAADTAAPDEAAGLEPAPSTPCSACGALCCEKWHTADDILRAAHRA